jgi:hypothetical protein
VYRALNTYVAEGCTTVVGMTQELLPKFGKYADHKLHVNHKNDMNNCKAVTKRTTVTTHGNTPLTFRPTGLCVLI